MKYLPSPQFCLWNGLMDTYSLEMRFMWNHIVCVKFLAEWWHLVIVLMRVPFSSKQQNPGKREVWCGRQAFSHTNVTKPQARVENPRSSRAPVSLTCTVCLAYFPTYGVWWIYSGSTHHLTRPNLLTWLKKSQAPCLLCDVMLPSEEEMTVFQDRQKIWGGLWSKADTRTTIFSSYST